MAKLLTGRVVIGELGLRDLSSCQEVPLELGWSELLGLLPDVLPATTSIRQPSH